MAGKTLIPLEGPPPGTVGPGTVHTLAMFGPSTTQVQDSNVLQYPVGAGADTRTKVRVLGQLGIADEGGFALDLYYAEIFTATGLTPDPTVPFVGGFVVDVTQQQQLITGFGTWTSFEDGFTATGASIGFTYLRGFSCDAFLDIVGGHTQHFYGFVSAPGWGNSAGLIDEFAAFYAIPFGGTTPATVAYGYFVDMSGMNAVTTWSIFATGAPVSLNGLVYPNVDGAAGDVVTTDGAGTLTLQPGAGTPSGWAEVPNVGVNLVTVTQTLLRAVIGAPDLTDQFNVDSSLNVEHVDPTGTYGFWNYINVGGDDDFSIVDTSSAAGLYMGPQFDITIPGAFAWLGVYDGPVIIGTGSVGNVRQFSAAASLSAPITGVTEYSGLFVFPSGGGVPITTAHGAHVNLNGLTGTDGVGLYVAAWTPGAFTNQWGLYLTDSDAYFGAAVKLDNNMDGAGAGLGTLTDAPHAGDPDAWLEVWRNGVQGWVPWWHA